MAETYSDRAWHVWCAVVQDPNWPADDDGLLSVEMCPEAGVPEELIARTYRLGWLSFPGVLAAWKAGASTPEEVLATGGRPWTTGEARNNVGRDDPYEPWRASGGRRMIGSWSAPARRAVRTVLAERVA